MTDPDLDQTRRRFARRQWSRRLRRWRPLLIVLALLALVAAGCWLVLFSTVLGVKSVDVSGTNQVSEAQVLAVARVTEDEPLARVDLDAITRRVESLAAVASADVSREWPDRVRISVIERQPVAVVEIGAVVKYVDADGALFGELKQRPDDLPLLTTTATTDADAIAEGAVVAASLPPAVERRVERLEVRSIDDITLVLDDERIVTWGSAEQSDDKGRVLAALLDAQPDAGTYNVSAPGQPATGPAPSDAPSDGASDGASEEASPSQ